MDVASEWGHGLVMAGVETCVCPPGYAGTSCEVSYPSGTSDCLMCLAKMLRLLTIMLHAFCDLT